MTRLHEISIAFQTDKRAADYVTLAQAVNAYAFDVVSVYCDAPYHPSFGPLLLMAPYVKRARLGAAAVSPARMAPLDMAANLALLADLAPGGVYLGIARGAWLAEHGFTPAETPIQQIRESIEIVQQLLSGGAGYEGRVYRLAPHVKAPYPTPEKLPPILVGTWGRKLCAVAGELADEVKVGGTTNPDIVPIIASYIAEGERRAQRRVGSVGVVVGAVCVVDEDRVAARAAARRSVALYLPVVAALDPSLEVDPELIARIAEHVNASQLDSAASLISDALLDKFAFSGNPSDIIRQSEALLNAGTHRIEFGTPHGLHDPLAGIRLLGEHVLPALDTFKP